MTDYNDLPGWRWSVLKHAEESPLHVQHALKDSGDTTARRLLRALHARLLEPDTFAALHPVYEGPVRRGKEYDAFCAAHPKARHVLNATEAATIAATFEGVMRHHGARALLEGDGLREHVFQWTHEDLACKAMVDRWKGGSLIDLKCFGTTDDRAVSRMILRNASHGQLAYYTEGCESGGLEVREHVILAYEGKGAQDVGVFVLDDLARAEGRAMVERCRAVVRRCIESGEWPGRAPEPVLIGLPSWATDVDDLLVTGGSDV